MASFAAVLDGAYDRVPTALRSEGTLVREAYANSWPSDIWGNLIDRRAALSESDGDATALFLLPVGTAAVGPVAAWATTAGWALGAEELLGSAWVVSDAGTFDPRQAAANVTRPAARASAPRPSWRRLAPEPAITLAKDMRQAVRGSRQHLGAVPGPWRASSVRFVWQRHTVFRRDGVYLRSSLGVPLVLSVHAMQVEEAAEWGVSRPGWASMVERFGELPQLRAADIMACVSDAVAASVERRGIPSERILVTPNGVDTSHFRARGDRERTRQEMELQDRFVIGWSGSFRRFHGLEQAIDVIAELKDAVPEVALLLVGDGQQRGQLEQRVSSLGLDDWVRFTGAVPHARMPSVLSACDVGLVLSPPEGSFHYSPVKLREYMACGLPVVAHAVGEVSSTLVHGVDAILVPRDNPPALRKALVKLWREPELRDRLSARGPAVAKARWAWSTQIRRVIEALDQAGPR